MGVASLPPINNNVISDILRKRDSSFIPALIFNLLFILWKQTPVGLIFLHWQRKRSVQQITSEVLWLFFWLCIHSWPVRLLKGAGTLGNSCDTNVSRCGTSFQTYHFAPSDASVIASESSRTSIGITFISDEFKSERATDKTKQQSKYSPLLAFFISAWNHWQKECEEVCIQIKMILITSEQETAAWPRHFKDSTPHTEHQLRDL